MRLVLEAMIPLLGIGSWKIIGGRKVTIDSKCESYRENAIAAMLGEISRIAALSWGAVSVVGDDFEVKSGTKSV